MANDGLEKHVYLRDRMEKWNNWLTGGLDAVHLIQLALYAPVLMFLLLGRLASGVLTPRAERKQRS